MTNKSFRLVNDGTRCGQVNCNACTQKSPHNNDTLGTRESARYGLGMSSFVVPSWRLS